MMRNYGFIPSELYGNSRNVATLGDVMDIQPSQGRVVRLYKYLNLMVGGPIVPRDQKSGSDCVGQSMAGAIDTLLATQIHGLGMNLKYVAPVSASSIYGLARVEIGKNRYRTRFSGDGAIVSHACEGVRDYGCLYMMPYPSIDLSTHSWAISKRWGSVGMPDELEGEAKLHGAVKDFIPINGWPQWVSAIENGFPVVFGSDLGFEDRDREGQITRQDGFLRPKGSWMHAEYSSGIDTLSARPGALVVNSWGKEWVRGPKIHEQPDGSFWIDADVADDICKRGEARAICGLNGFEATKLKYVLC